MYSYYLGLKYLLSRPINLLSLCGVIVAVWALVVVVSIFSGYLVDLERHIQGVTSDLAFIHRGARPRHDWERLETLLREEEAVAAFAPRLSWYGLLHGKRSRAMDLDALQKGPTRDFVQIIGIDVVREARVSDLSAWLRAVEAPGARVEDPTHPFRAPDGIRAREDGCLPTPVLLGMPRIEGAGYVPGQTLDITSGRESRFRDVETIQEPLVMAGAFSSPYHHFDAGAVLVDIAFLQRIFGKELPAGRRLQLFNEISIRVHPGQDLQAVAGRLQKRFDKIAHDEGIPTGAFITWRARNRAFLDNVAHQEFLMKLMLFVLIVVAAFLIFATLSMMVTEKTRDIGILAALGATRSGILAVFTFSGFAIAILGTFGGLGLALLTVEHLNDFDRWLEASFGIELFRVSVYGLKEVPHRIDPVWVGWVFFTTLGLSTLSALIPGLRASRMDPVRALRHE